MMKVAFGTLLIFLQCLCGFSYTRDDCVCGQMNNVDSIYHDTNRIINGTVVPPHKYPWMVSIQVIINGVWTIHCGGSIISDRTILSAGHCIMGIRGDSARDIIRFVTGVDVISKQSADQIYYYDVIFKHPYFYHDIITDTSEYDLAMIVVDRTIKFGPTVSPICLPSIHDHELFVHQIVTAAGWGSEEVMFPELPKENGLLMETKIRLMSNEECTPDDADDYVHELFREAIICTLGESTGACYGDSGGPIFGNYDVNHHVILGVASYIISDLCAQGYPDYFAKVPNLFTLDWIYDIIGESGGNVCMSPKFLY